jgi:hypothetical protein
LCTTYKGVPYGLAIINYKDPNNKDYSFKGVGIFNEGILDMTPFSYIDGNGTKY